MASMEYLEVYKAARHAQERFAYFLLAAAGAGVALALDNVRDVALAWSGCALGGAMLTWAVSFVAGCRHLVAIEDGLFANLLLIGTEEFAQKDRAQKEIQKAAHFKTIDAAANRSSFYAKLQWWSFVVGTLLMTAWYVQQAVLRAGLRS